MQRSLTALLFVLLLGFSCARRPTPNTSDAPLIYVFTIDSLRNDLIGLRYNDRVVMPNLTAFANESVYFENAYSQSPFTKISVSSLFTGLWPGRLGVKNCTVTVFPEGVELCRGLDSKFDTMAEYLARREYETFTSLFTFHVRKGDGLLQGFQYQEKRLPNPLPISAKTFVYDHVIGLHAPYKPSAESLVNLGITAPSEVDATGSDWFWKPLTRDQGTELYEHYLAEGSDWDRRFGDLKNQLQASNSWEDAFVVVTSDHGEEFLEHGGTQHSVQLYDDVLRVPLFVKFPSSSRLSKHHGSKRPERVRLIDVLPTVIHFVDGEAPTFLDGRSLIPLIDNQERQEAQRPVLAFASIQRMYKNETMSFESRALISGRFKAIMGYRGDDSQLMEAFRYRRGDEIRELFDLEADPHELNNLVLHRSELFETLRMEYSRHSTAPRFDTPLAATEQSEEERREREMKLRSLGYLQ